MAESVDNFERRRPDELSDLFGGSSQLEFDLRFFAKLLARAPHHVPALRCQAELLSRRGQHDQALDLYEALVALRPNDPIAHYNLACGLSKCGRPQQGFDALLMALNFGYEDFEYLEQDPDLAPVRALPKYQELMMAICDLDETSQN